MPTNISMPDILTEIEKSIIILAENSVSKYKKQAIDDGKKLLNDIKADLERWTKLLENQELKINEFEFLVLSSKEIIKMSALKQSGLAQLRIVAFVDSALNIVIDTILKYVIGNI